MTISPAFLRKEAERCRMLAETCSDERTARSLRLMAKDYAAKAAEAEGDTPAGFMLVSDGKLQA